ELEYLGRGDHQVKIRGFRIELGEIESALRGCEGVDDAVVLAEKGSAGQVRLVAYVLNAQAVIDSAPLRAQLGQSLPDYMVPSIFMAVAAWPLTANGKLDVKALPDARERFQVEYLAPRTEVEVKLAEIWAEILELEQVSVTANFFAQGGDSIRAVRLIARCGQEGFALAVRDLFAYQSIELMANAISSRSTATTHLAVDAGPFSLLTPEERVLVDVAKYEDGYPLTQLQEGMVFHNQRDGDYLIIDSVKLERPWSEAALQEALTGMMTRHEILRTVFDYDIGYRPLQLVLRDAPLPLQVHDWRHLEATESEAKFATWYDCQVANTSVFDGKAPLWSIDVHCVSDAVFHYTLIHHHAILDGWSVSSFNTELFQRYLEVQRLLPEIARSSLPPYRHYVAQELASLADPKARAFWGEMIASATMPTWEAGKRLTAQSAHLDLSTRGEQLRELCARLGVAPRTVLLAVYLKVLAFLNGAESITSSVTGHGRLEVAGADRSLGLFLSTLPICTNIDQPSWSVLISAVDSQLQQAWNYRHYPVSQLQRDSGVDLSAALFNYTDFHVYDGVNGDGISGMDTFEVTNYRLLCHWTHDPRQGQLNLSISADAGLYSTEALQHVMINFERALDAALLCTNEPVWTASLMAPAERERLLQLGRATQSTAPAQCLHQLFTAQALATPQAMALIDGERHWTYAELEAASNQLAHRLLASGAAPGARVGLCLERSGEVVQAILAILKCGAAYVPLDPIYPAERIAYMLDDAAVTLVVA
ncbi:hypothetical protein CSQ93_28455, partial [Janthinobacterium sp. BJB426]|uniref:condensation domain-containing protein n=1 Tax=Janthinobacterium sp. BJB426 TaxID=2048010 RepID=UPI000C0EFD7F